MSKHFYTDIDLRLNQLLKSILEHIDSTTIDSGLSGRIFWAIDLDAPAYWDGNEVKLFAYKGQPIDPNDVVEDASHQWVTVSDIAAWNEVVNNSGNYELISKKNVPFGYAGLDGDNKLSFSTLWDGMIVEYPAGSNLYKTMEELFDIPNGISTLDENGQLNPTIINQTGFTADQQVLFCSQTEKDSWNAISGGLSGVEIVAHKNQPDGYAGLNADARVNKRYLPEGVVLRRYKKYYIEFTGNIVEGEQIAYTYNEDPTEYFNAGPSPDLSLMINDIAASLSTISGLSVQHDLISITVTANNIGDDYKLEWLYLNHTTGNLLINAQLIEPAFYDWSNMAGTNDIGYAPLNHFGVIDDTYLPSYKDIKIVDDYDDLLAITDQYNGLRVHVIDASGDPSVDEGWAEYLWYEDDLSWHKTTERESSIDISHNSMSNVQGDGALLNPPQTNHITDAQYQQLKDSEYLETVNHLDARPGVILKIFPKSNFRAAKISFTLEDHAGRGILMEDLNILFDGNYPTMLEIGEISSAMNNPFTFNLDHDINNIYLKMTSNSNDCSSRLRIREFLQLDNIIPPLTPEIDMAPSSGLLPHN